MIILAGFDIDGFGKLFKVDNSEQGFTYLTHDEWVKILDDAGADMGEMLLVGLERMKK